MMMMTAIRYPKSNNIYIYRCICQAAASSPLLSDTPPAAASNRMMVTKTPAASTRQPANMATKRG